MTSYVSKNKVGLVALATVAVMALSWFLASVCDPGWEIGKDRISDLGASSVESAAVIFNYGFAVVGGALLALTGMLYLLTFKTKKSHVIMGLLVTITGIALACAGICNIGDAVVDDKIQSSFIGVAILAGIIVYILALFEAWLNKRYFDGIILTTGFVITSALLLAGFETAEVSLVVFFLMLATLYGASWIGQKHEENASLYDTRLNA